MSVLHLGPPPPALQTAIERVARERFGAGDLAGAELARAVRRVSEAYTRITGDPEQLQGDRAALCARLKFFLPRDFPKLQAPLAELAAVAAFPAASELRVLDLGAGLGTSGLSTAAFALQRPGVSRVRIDAVDRDGEALAIAARLAEVWASAAGLALELRSLRAPLKPATFGKLAGPYDLIVLGFVLNELAGQGGAASEPHVEHHALLRELCTRLAPDGALIVLEPALRETSRSLQRVRGLFAAAEGPPYVFAPCLHRGACPLLERERDWCHEQLPLALPEPLRAVARGAGLRAAELSYSYLTLHRAPRSLRELAPEGRAVRVVSGPLRSKGKLELLLCGQETPRRLQRLERDHSAANAALDPLGRGAVVALPTDAPGVAQLLRVRAQTQITALQRIEAEPADEAPGL